MDKSAEPLKNKAPDTAESEKDRLKQWEETHAHKSRTTGLKLLDVLIYPVLTNFSVFAISVVATYLTSKGGMKRPDGTLKYGKIGEWFQNRGSWLAGKFRALGMSEAQADMSKMVAFSFIDGSIMSVPVKLLEDRREEIGRAIDEKLGTKPEDESVYAAEPKQTWLSVLGGRFLTASIVVPTAVALDKTGMNDAMFNKPGLKAGAWLEKQPILKNVAKNHDVKEAARIGVFEAFYTTVCTLGLYISSRCIARATGKKVVANTAKTAEEALPETPPAAPAETSEKQPQQTLLHADESLKKKDPKPMPLKAGFAERYHSEPSGQQASLAL